MLTKIGFALALVGFTAFGFFLYAMGWIIAYMSGTARGGN